MEKELDRDRPRTGKERKNRESVYWTSTKNNYGRVLAILVRTGITHASKGEVSLAKDRKVDPK